MYFIHKGVVEVVSEDGAVVFAKMEAGAFFGEIALLFSCPRTASIRTQRDSDLFVLSRSVSTGPRRASKHNERLFSMYFAREGSGYMNIEGYKARVTLLSLTASTHFSSFSRTLTMS